MVTKDWTTNVRLARFPNNASHMLVQMTSVMDDLGLMTAGSMNIRRIKECALLLGRPSTAVLRHDGTPVQVAFDALSQRVRGFGLAMHHIDLIGLVFHLA